MAAAVTLTASLSSCEEEDMQTDYLCSRIWTDEWTDEYGTYHYQEISFYPDYTGKDYVYTEDASTGLGSERVYYFDWDWESYSSIYMRYPDGESYMDNVSLGQNKLDCKLDGIWVTFIGK